MTTNTDVKTSEQIKVDIQPPKMWKVVFLNDNVTPMELVIDILKLIFKHSEEEAKKLTLEIHNEGSAIVGVFIHEMAEQFALEATNYARKN